MENVNLMHVPDEWKNKTASELRELAFQMYNDNRDVSLIVEYIHVKYDLEVDFSDLEKKPEKKTIVHVNLGTFPVGQAKRIAKIMREMKDNEKVGIKPETVVLRGRGKRLPSQQSSVPLDQASGAAIYIDVDITRECERAVDSNGTLKDLLLERAKVNELHDALEIETNKKMLATSLKNTFVDYLALRYMEQKPESVFNALVNGYSGLTNLTETELMVGLAMELGNDARKMKNSLLKR